LPQPQLKKEISAWGLAFNLMNIMIGAGIFILPAIIAELLGPASFTAYLLCGILLMLIMLCFAEVGSHIDADGGLYAYIDRILGDYFGFTAAVLLLVAGIAADAAVANALVDVVNSLVEPDFSQAVRVILLLVIFGGFAFIHIRGIKQGINMVRILILLKIIPLILFLFLTASDIRAAHLALDGFPSLKDISSAALILFFAFLGTESGISVSGEVRNPQKSIPRGILIAISAVLILYMLIQGAALGVLGPELGRYRENPLGEVARAVMGSAGLTLMIIGAGVSMFGYLSSAILSMPRVIFGASRDGVIPLRLLSAIHPKFASPYVAILIYVSLDFVVASMGGFEQLAIFASASVFLLYFGIVISVIVLRRSPMPKPEGAFRIPGGIIVPFLAGITIVWFMTSLSNKEWIALAILVALLTILYFAGVRKLRKNVKDKSPPAR